MLSPSIMRNLMLPIILCLLALNGCASSSANVDLVGHDVGNVKFQTLDGNWRILDEFKGKTTVLVFWASWCSRSRSTIQSLNELAHRSSNHPERAFIAINIDKLENEKKFREFIREVPIDGFLQSFSGNEVYDEAWIRMQGDEIPLVFIIDPSGKVAEVGHGDKFVYEYFHEMK